MINKLVLHIGFPKTGTTSLQILLDQNSDSLEEIGIRYHPSFRQNGSAHHNIGILANNNKWKLIKDEFKSCRAS